MTVVTPFDMRRHLIKLDHICRHWIARSLVAGNIPDVIEWSKQIIEIRAAIYLLDQRERFEQARHEIREAARLGLWEQP